MSDAQTFTLTNEGNEPAMANQPSVDDPATFPMTLISPVVYPAFIGAGGTATVEVRFAPASGGPKSATLTFTSTAPNTPHTAALSGNNPVMEPPLVQPDPVLTQPRKKCKKGRKLKKGKCVKKKRKKKG